MNFILICSVLFFSVLLCSVFRIEMRRDRMKKVETDENKKSSGNSAVAVAVSAAAAAVAAVRTRNIKEFGYIKLVDGNLIKLNWTATENRKKNQSMKLFTIKCVENLIEVILTKKRVTFNCLVVEGTIRIG